MSESPEQHGNAEQAHEIASERIRIPTEIYSPETLEWELTPTGLSTIKRGQIVRMLHPETRQHMPIWQEDDQHIEGAWYGVAAEDGFPDEHGHGLAEVDHFEYLDEAIAHAATFAAA